MAGGTVNAGAGTTVVIGSGATVVLPASASTTGDSAPSGPNFLQVATSKWYEAATLQRIGLPGPPGAMTFDGRSVWIALSGADRLVRV